MTFFSCVGSLQSGYRKEGILLPLAADPIFSFLKTCGQPVRAGEFGVVEGVRNQSIVNWKFTKSDEPYASEELLSIWSYSSLADKKIGTNGTVPNISIFYPRFHKESKPYPARPLLKVRYLRSSNP